MTVKDTKAHQEAAILAGALPYMRRHKGATFVVKLGGSAMQEGEPLLTFAKDVSLLRQVGIHVDVVHGGGPQIGDMLKRLNVKTEFVDGLRVSDADTVSIVEMVLGSISKKIVTAIEEQGGMAVGLSGKDGGMVRAKKIKHKDIGLVGEPSEINPDVLHLLKKADIIPVIAPIACDEQQQTHNINADVMAGAIAAVCGASRLFLLTDVSGVLNEKGELMEQLTIREARVLIKKGIIQGGMLPKVETCIKAIEEGVEAAVIVNGLMPHAILLETFTHHGAGTLIKP